MSDQFDQVNKGAVQLALEKQLFGRFTTRERTLSVGATPVVALLNNPERIAWVIVNTGTERVTFRLNQDVTAGQGFSLPNQGDTVSVNYLEDGQYPTHEISVIADAAGGELFITEFIRYGL